MKVFNLIFIALFIVFAGLQYNDPDPYIWIPLYGYGAFLCYMAIRRTNKLLLFSSGIIIYSVYALFLLFDDNGVLGWIHLHGAENIAQEMHAGKPWIEETREFFGLVILIAVEAINIFWLARLQAERAINA